MNKFCANCGKELKEGQDICLNCGQMVKKSNTQNNTVKPTNGLAIGGFILSIIGLLLSVFIIGIPLCVIGLILSIIGLFKAKSLNGSGKGLAIAGTIINGLVTIISVVILIAFMTFLSKSTKPVYESIVQNTCNTYGSNYEAVEGDDVIGSYDDDSWYCCQKGQPHMTSYCIDVSY